MVRSLSALALALALTPRPAAAHTEDQPALTIFAPADGAQEVPTNTLVWLDDHAVDQGDEQGELHLRSLAGDDIPLTRSSEIATPIGAVTVWQPDRALQPDTRYLLWRCDQADCTTMLAEFRTRSGPSESAPQIPSATRLVESGDLLDTDAEFTGLLVLAAGTDDLDGDARAGEVVAIGQPGEPIVFYAHQSVNSVHLGAYDLAGNFSGFSGPLPVERAKTPVCHACDVSDDPPGVLLIALLALAVRRRRRAPAPT
jgi:MYXO-CTERM domain-containing protein